MNINELKKEINALEERWDTEVGPWYHYTLGGAEYMDEDAPVFIRDLDREIYDRLTEIWTEIDRIEEERDWIDAQAIIATLSIGPLDLYRELCGMTVEVTDGPTRWEIWDRDSGAETFNCHDDLLEWVRDALWYMWEAYRDQGEVDEWNAAVERVREAR